MADITKGNSTSARGLSQNEDRPYSDRKKLATILASAALGWAVVTSPFYVPKLVSRAEFIRASSITVRLATLPFSPLSPLFFSSKPAPENSQR